MHDHTRAHECVPALVPVHAPGIARAIGEDFEIFRARVIPREGRIHGHARTFWVIWITNLRMREDPFGHIKPAIRSPGETVEQLVPVLHTEACFKNRCLVRLAVSVRVLQEIKVGSGADIDSAVAQRQASGEAKAVRENGYFVGASIAIGVFENFDAIAPLLAFGCPFGIFVQLQHPEPAAFIPAHSHGVHHLRFRGEESHFEARGHMDFLAGLFRGEGGRRGRGMRPGELFPRWVVLVDREVVFFVRRNLVIGGTGYSGQSDDGKNYDKFPHKLVQDFSRRRSQSVNAFVEWAKP